RIAGNGGYCDADIGLETLADCGVPGPALEARLSRPYDVAVAPDGTVYYSDWYFGVYSIDADGFIRVVAGGNYEDRCADLPGDDWANCALEGVATELYVYPNGIDVGPDGALYIADIGWGQSIARVTPDGIVTTIVGATNGADRETDPACRQEGVPASRACLVPFDVAVGPDGTIYALDFDYVDGMINRRTIRVVEIGADGLWKVVFDHRRDLDPTVHLVAGTRLAVGQDGMLYLAGYENNWRIHLIDPRSRTVWPIAGTGERVVNAAPAGNAALVTDLTEPYAVAVGPDGLVYFGDGTVIRRVAPVNPGLGAGFYVLSSDDGRQLYEFDAHGRHL